MTDPERALIGWDEPRVERVAEWLRTNDPAALDETLLVVPTGRARRLLLERLLVDAPAGVVAPPRIRTVGDLSGSVLNVPGPIASTLTTRVAWLRALRAAPAAAAAVFPQLRPDDGEAAWWGAAMQLAALNRDLAAAGLDVPGAWARLQHVLPELGGGELLAAEDERWTRGLLPLAAAWAAELSAAGLHDRDAARLAALADGAWREPLPRRIVVACAPDLNGLQRALLQGAAERTAVVVLVHGPTDDASAERFDALGAPRLTSWTRPGALAPWLDGVAAPLHVAAGPRDQAAAALACLSGSAGPVAATDLSIGVPDAEVTAPLAEALAAAGAPAHEAAPRPLGRTRPLVLLRAVATVLERPDDLRAVAALVRHPDIEATLDEPPSNRWQTWPALLDAELHEHHGARDADGRLRSEALTKLRKALDERLAPLVAAAAAPAVWAETLGHWLASVYGRPLVRHEPDDHELVEALSAIGRALGELAALPPAWPDAAAACWTAADALRWLLRALADERVPAPNVSGVELLGWLELPWEATDRMVVTGLNEGRVPGGELHHPLLPDRARQALGLEHDAQRLARDAYNLAVLAAGRQARGRGLWLICGRQDSDGGPLAPSRLLFLGRDADAERIARQVFATAPGRRASPGDGAASVYAPPAPDPAAGARIEELAATAFRSYLQCPYRFYLRHVLGLRRVEAPPRELDAGAFGTLLHDVLDAAFRREPALFAGTAARLSEALESVLRERAAARYGMRPAPAIAIQVEQAAERLRRFAGWQSAEADRGWRPVASERAFRRGDDGDSRVPLDLGDGDRLWLVGTVDRLDRHEELGWRLWDYKSGNTPRRPEQRHRHRGGWLDLQLPLYAHLFAHAPEFAADPGEIRVGTINLSATDERDAGFCLAGWGEAEFGAALAVARRVGRAIRAGEFAVLNVDPAGDLSYDELADLCLRRQFAALPAGLRPVTGAAPLGLDEAP